MNTSLLLQLAYDYIQAHPTPWLGKINFHGQHFWIKQRPFSKKTTWHRLQNLIARSLSCPVLTATATSGGPQSLYDEAARLHLFAQHGIPAPRVLACTQLFILTEDVGLPLHHHLRAAGAPIAKQALLQQAILALNRLHQAGLCHARPSFSDMTYRDDTIFFIDLEEDPLSVMTLPEAQARDVWLFFNNAAAYSQKDPAHLQCLFADYQSGISAETLRALQKIVKLLKPLRQLSPLVQPLLGKDAQRAILANQALERALL